MSDSSLPPSSTPPEYPQEYQPQYEQEYQPAYIEKPLFPLVVWALIAINVSVFIIQTITGGLDGPAEAGILWAPGVWQGEWWRLLTAMFLHANLLHLGVNMWALKVLGGELETVYGRLWFLALYFGAGWAGSLASLMFTGSSVGASGAIFGLAGAWLAISLYRRKYFQMFGTQVLMVVGINLFIGFSASGIIDNNGHIGGLLGGLALGAVLPSRLPEFQARWRVPATVILLLILLGLTVPANQFSQQNLANTTEVL